MGGLVWRRRVATTVPLAVLTGLAAAPALADGTPSEEPVVIDRVVQIDRVLEVRLVEAVNAEIAAAEAALDSTDPVI